MGSSKNFFVAVFFLLSFFSILVSAEIIDKVLVTVNQEPITSYDVEDAVAKIRAQSPAAKTASAEELKKVALDHLIEEALIHQEMISSGIEVSDKEVTQAVDSVLKRNQMTMDSLKKELASKGTRYEDYRNDLADQLKRIRWVQQVVGSKIKINEDEVQAFYEQNVGQIKGSQVHIAQIVIPLVSTSKEEVERVQAKANEAYQKIKGGKNFDSILKEYGGPGSGDLGKVDFVGVSPQVANALQSLNEGEVSEPVHTANAFLIVKLLEKPGVALQGSEDVKNKIRDQLYDMKVQEEIRKYADQLKSKAFIDVK